MKNILRKNSYLLFIVCLVFVSLSIAGKKQKDFYQIKVYNLKDNAQMLAVDQYLKNAYLPALHRAGVAKVGVFKPIANDTAQVNKIFIFIPFNSIKKWQSLQEEFDKDGAYQTASKDYADAAADKKPFERIESILLEAFAMHTKFELPGLKNPLAERVYELRSYESPTEHLHKTKVKMFNEGGESVV